jgi:transcription-repair coupling factor (superfamily II helicase)
MSQILSLVDFQSIELKASRSHWGALNPSEQALAIVQQAQNTPGLVVLVCKDMAQANEMMDLTQFFAPDDLTLLPFPEWETLPYDRFHRIKTLFPNA